MLNNNLKELQSKIEEHIADYNKALKDDDFKAMTAADHNLSEAEAKYADVKMEAVFKDLAETKEPEVKDPETKEPEVKDLAETNAQILRAIIKHSYNIVGHKSIREGGVLLGYELVDDKLRQIDLIKFCRYLDVSIDWQYKVEKFNQLLAFRTANELKMSKKQIEKLADSYYMNRLSREVEMGKTPDSNTQIVKLLQEVIDSIFFFDDGKGKGKNLYKVNNHDVAYLLMCYTRRGKKVLSVNVAKHAYMHRLIMDVAHRIATNKVYDLEYKMKKTKEPEVKDPETKEPEVEVQVIEKKEEEVKKE